MYCGRDCYALQRAVDGLYAVGIRAVGIVAQPGFVELNDIRTGRRQVAHFDIDRRRIGHRQRLRITVVLIPRLLAEGEGAGQGNLHAPVGVALEKQEILDFHRRGSREGPDHAWQRHFEVLHAPNVGMFQIETSERRRKVIGIAFPSHLTVGNDIDAGALLISDREQSGVVLRLDEPRFGDTPDVACTHTRHDLGFEQIVIDQPGRLRIAADDGGGEG